MTSALRHQQTALNNLRSFVGNTSGLVTFSWTLLDRAKPCKTETSDAHKACVRVGPFMQDVLEIIKEAAQPGALVSSAMRALRLMTSEPEASGLQRQQEAQEESSYAERQLSMQVCEEQKDVLLSARQSVLFNVRKPRKSDSEFPTLQLTKWNLGQQYDLHIEATYNVRIEECHKPQQAEYVSRAVSKSWLPLQGLSRTGFLCEWQHAWTAAQSRTVG